MQKNDERPSRPVMPARSSVRKKVVAGLTFIMFAFLSLTVYSIVWHRDTVAKVSLVNNSYLPLALGTSEIRATQLVFNTMMDRLADAPNLSGTREWIDAARRFRPSMLRKLSDLVGAKRRNAIPKKEAVFLAEMGRRLKQVERRYGENESRFQEIYDLMATGKIDEARVQIESLKRAERLLDRVLAGIGSELDHHITDISEETESQGARATWVLSILTVAVLLIAIAVVVTTNRLLWPLKTLQTAVARVAEGNLDARVVVPREDEFGALASGFNRMTEALAERDEMLIRSERLATTGKMAAQVTHEIRNPLSSSRSTRNS